MPTREKDGTTVAGRIAIDPRKAGQDLRITASVNIRRPVGEVFAFAGDYENDPLWRSGVVEMRYETPGPYAPGRGPGRSCDSRVVA